LKRSLVICHEVRAEFVRPNGLADEEEEEEGEGEGEGEAPHAGAAGGAGAKARPEGGPMKFGGLILSGTVAQRLRDEGITAATPVQWASIKKIMRGGWVGGGGGACLLGPYLTALCVMSYTHQARAC
jgi:hypothetical protein